MRHTSRPPRAVECRSPAGKEDRNRAASAEVRTLVVHIAGATRVSRSAAPAGDPVPGTEPRAGWGDPG